jgi:hypothetical protein
MSMADLLQIGIGTLVSAAGAVLYTVGAHLRGAQPRMPTPPPDPALPPGSSPGYDREIEQFKLEQIRIDQLRREVLESRVSISPRDASLPPPSVPGYERELEQFRRDLAALEQRFELADAKAATFREKVLQRLARVMERLKIQEENDNGDRGT